MKLTQIMNNFHALELNDDITIYFSYSTPIALDVREMNYVAKNQWSRTTGKHINWYKQSVRDKCREPEEVEHDELLFLLDLYVSHPCG